MKKYSILISLIFLFMSCSQNESKSLSNNTGSGKNQKQVIKVEDIASNERIAELQNKNKFVNM